MIRPIDIRLNAAHPDYPLAEAVTFTGSPSTVLIRGVPPNCGRWAITAVSVAASYPDGSTTTRAAVQSANGVWVATLPATATSGRTANGLRILADGIDENGEAVTGYVLGVADFAVASLDVTPAPQPGETSYQMLYFDAVPGVLRKGDVAKVDGVLKFYNGEAWEAFATPPTLDDAVTRTSENGVKSSGIWSAIWGALSALPTGFSSLYDWVVNKLSGKLDADGGTMTGMFWLKGMLKVNTGDTTAYEIDYYGIRVHYQGGVTKRIYMPVLASLANGGYMAVVENLAPGFSTSATYYKDDLVKYNGALYICTATSHTGAWSDSDFAVATIQDALALKLGHEGPWVNGYIDVLERNVGESVPYGVRIYRDKIVFGAFTNTVPRGFTPIREFALPSAGGTLALTSDLRYNLNPITIASSGAATATLADLSTNIIVAAADVTSITFTFPPRQTGKMRDFFIRLVIQGTTVPTLYFNEPDGGGAVAFDADDDAWADIEPGVNIMMFSDTAE